MGRRRGPRPPHVPGPQRHLVNVLRTAQVIARIVTETLSESSPRRPLPAPDPRGFARPCGRLMGTSGPPCGPNHRQIRPWWLNRDQSQFPPGQGGRPTTQHNAHCTGQRYQRHRGGRPRASEITSAGRIRPYQSYTVTIDNPNCSPSASSLSQSPRVTSGPQTSAPTDPHTQRGADDTEGSTPVLLDEEEDRALIDPID